MFCSFLANCPVSSKMQSCSPKCKDDTECFGQKCCPNICNTKSCTQPNQQSGANNGYKGSSCKLCALYKKYFFVVDNFSLQVYFLCSCFVFDIVDFPNTKLLVKSLSSSMLFYVLLWCGRKHVADVRKLAPKKYYNSWRREKNYPQENRAKKCASVGTEGEASEKANDICF